MAAQQVFHRSTLLIFVLQFIIGVSLGVGATQVGDCLPVKDGWQDLHYKIYSTNQTDAMKPKHLLVKLEELAKFYEPFDDCQTNNRKTRINELIECSKIGLEHCNLSKFVLLKRLRDRNSLYKVNLVQYLDYYTNKLFSLCFRGYKVLLKASLEHLSDQDKLDVEQLHQVMAETRVRGKELGHVYLKRSGGLPYEYMLKGSIQYMSQKLSKLKQDDWINNETRYRQYLNEHLIQVCSRLREALDPLIAMTQMTTKNHRLHAGAKRLVTFGFVCGALVSQSDRLTHDSYNKLVRVDKILGDQIGRRELLVKLGENSIDIDDLDNDRRSPRDHNPNDSDYESDVICDKPKNCLRGAKRLFKNLIDQPVGRLFT